MRMHALINNAVVKHKVPGSFHLFSDAKRSLMKIKCGAQESDCTFTLAHHLLSKLHVAVSSFYKMDSGYKTQQFTCPCQCGEHSSGIYSDTSIGMSHSNLSNIATKYMKKTLQLFKLNKFI